MYLPANSVRALDALGLKDAVRARANEITHQRFLDHRGRLLLDVDLPRVWGDVGPCVAISHGSLHEILREGIGVRLATNVTALRQDGPLVQAAFEDGGTGSYDLVVGADGVRSWVRSEVFGGGPPRSLGQASWRFLVDGFPEITEWTVRLGRGGAFLTIPLGGGRIYCYLDIDATTPDDPASGDADRLRELFDGFAHPIPAILKEQLQSGAFPYFSPIEEVIQEPWVREPIVLVGDAAHATSPNMAEGAGMALEDAIVLGETIAADRPLGDFEARRRPRVSFVQHQTHKRDRARNLPTPIRNAALRLAGQRIFRGNYLRLRDDP